MQRRLRDAQLLVLALVEARPRIYLRDMNSLALQLKTGLGTANSLHTPPSPFATLSARPRRLA
jgi:hypothetical protein